jgi:hypothetical protein
MGCAVQFKQRNPEAVVMSEGTDGGGAAVSHLYRFRSIKSLLDRGELENQEIYLAPPEAMNDPTEALSQESGSSGSVVYLK